jgi:2-dehydropantoate 2-reductase
MRIAVWGAGSLGLMWAARLELAGWSPVLITREKQQRDQIREKGITLVTVTGKVHRLSIESRWAEEEMEALDQILLMVKQTALPTAVRQSLRRLHPEGTLWLWQNGMGGEEVLPKTFPQKRVIQAVTTEGARKESDTEVVQTGTGRTWVGSLAGNSRSADVDRLLQSGQSIGADLRWDPDIRHRMWEKLLINSVINPLTAILHVTNGELIEKPSFFSLALPIVEEATAVAEAEGYAFDVGSTLQRVTDVCRQTAPNHSSMLQDVRKGRTTEISAINGYIAKKGEVYGIATPVNQWVTELVSAISGRNTGTEESLPCS